MGGDPFPCAAHMILQDLIHKIDQFPRRPVDFAKKPVLYNSCKRDHIEVGHQVQIGLFGIRTQRTELLPDLFNSTMDNLVDIGFDKTPDMVAAHGL